MVQDTSISVHLATRADLVHAKEIHQLVNLAFRSEEGWMKDLHVTGGERLTVEGVEKVILDEKSPLYIAVDASQDGLAVGTVQIQPNPEEAEEAEIGLLAVHPKAQSRGIGYKLFLKALEEMPKLGYKKAVLHVLSNRPDLLLWYQSKFGFQLTDETSPYPHPEMLKDKSIHFLVVKKDV
ncbi:acyl-CoA N-acyltransferase [Hesseltinella vesiculosa]|uniref:Acyl-CoA N-acyltransferase n=1 Tax=Hesseltinella vesiculosa TaxID=101127 RepID=A0A1X2GI93_9FUNG|nr:acyl-CoA N-acyltransferase [Hesseltinella vesiculosa]